MLLKNPYVNNINLVKCAYIEWTNLTSRIILLILKLTQVNTQGVILAMCGQGRSMNG